MRSCRHLPLLQPERTAAMNWNQLQYIVTTAQEKSITKAAKKLFISQPSLTLSIQNLEKELGVELFERNRGSFTLTYAGQLYYDWALSTLHAKERLGDRLGDIREGHSHLIRLGISPHRSATLLPVILPRFYKKFPASEIFLEEKPAGLEVVLTGRNPSQKMMDHADYISEICKRKHPFDRGISARIGIER